MSAPCLPALLTPDSLTALRGTSLGLSRRLRDWRPWESSLPASPSVLSLGAGFVSKLPLKSRDPSRGCALVPLGGARHCPCPLRLTAAPLCNPPPTSGPACDPGPPGHTSNLNPQGGVPRPAAAAPPGAQRSKFTPDLLSGKNPLFLPLVSYSQHF